MLSGLLENFDSILEGGYIVSSSMTPPSGDFQDPSIIAYEQLEPPIDICI